MLRKSLPYSLILSATLIAASVTPALAQTNATTPAANNLGAPAMVMSPSPTAKATTPPRNKLLDMVKDKSATKQADLRPAMASAEGGLKERLKLFKDRKKADIIERINQTLININQRRTSEMLRHIDTMNMILGKAQTRAGSNNTEELTSAANALANAKTAVEGQSKKTYDIKIASESGARADVKLTRDALEKDLKSTHELVAEARRTLINAIIKLAQSLGEQVNAAN